LPGVSVDPASVPPRQAAWLAERLEDQGPFSLEPVGGGNSNETLLLRSPAAVRVLRRPPADLLDPTANRIDREHRVLTALVGRGVPAPAPRALCEDPAVAGAPFMVMDFAPGISIWDELPPGLEPGGETAAAIGEAVVDAVAALHRVDWRAAGLDGFGRPQGFVARQVPRWRKQLERHRSRQLPWFDEVGEWLAANAPPETEPAILHGDFVLHNCLVTAVAPVRVTAIIDWELATIGDPLLDLGLFLAFWGSSRPSPPAIARVQAVSRVDGAPSREALAVRYAATSGRSVAHLPWYMALAFWKLASIAEGTYRQFRAGTIASPYAAGLERDVPRLLAEAAGFAGLRSA
jgi:aminoglycoside phosphotransferase (APT) family kinase protein